MKRILTLIILLALTLSVISCGGSSNEKAIIGTWQIVDTNTMTEYGFGLEFTDDGKLRYGLTEDVIADIADGENAEDAMAGLDMLMTIEYELESDTEMKVTVSALFGLAKESSYVSYSLNGDTLTFDGAVYSRVK